MPAVTSVTHEFLSELVDIIDKVPSREHDPSYLELRSALGKPPLLSLQEQVAQANLNIFFTSNFSVNPPTSSTTGASIETGGAQFVGGRWQFMANNTLTFRYWQNAFQEIFEPVTLRITGVPANEAATRILLFVNDLEIFSDYQLSKARGAMDGTYEFFIPSVCFLGGTNTFRFSVRSAGQSLAISQVQVTSATGLGDINATYEALCQLMSLVGRQNTAVRSHWSSLERTLQWHSDYFGPGIRGRTNEMGARLTRLTNQMTADANAMNAISRNYFQNQLHFLLDPRVSFVDKQRVLQDLQRTIQDQLRISNSLQADLAQFRRDCAELREEIQEIATQAEQSLKQALKDVDRQIDEVNIRLTGYRAQLEAATIGLAASIVAGPVGVWGSLAFLGPIAGPIAAVGFALASLIGIGISVAFIERASREINSLEAQLVTLTNRRASLAAELERVREMTQDIMNADEAFIFVAQYSRMFSHMWQYIGTQLTHIDATINGVPEQESIVFDVMAEAALSLKPFFEQINSVISHFMNPR